MTPAFGRPRDGINPWFIAGTVMLATFMEVLDTSVANVSLPHIAGNLSASVDESTWVLTSYLVANGIVLPMSGFLSVLFGRKRFYMTCVLLFTLSSMMCGFAPSLGLLVFFRVLQGLGGGALQPISQAILVESFPREKQGMAQAVYGMGVVVAPVIGPTLGGWITDNYTWRWIFLINIPVGVLSLLMTYMMVHDPPYLAERRKKGVRIDYGGVGLLALGLASLEIMLDEGQREDWFSSHLIVTAAVLAVAGLIAVVLWELRQKEPVVDFRMLKDRNFAIATGSMFLLGFVLYSSTAMLPIFLQTLMGYNATLSGEVISPGGIAIILMMPIVGRLVGKMDPRPLVIFGLSISALGLIQMAHFNLYIDYRTAVIARIVQSVGLAFLFIPINVTAFAFVPKEKTNYATGLVNVARNIGGSSGIALATTLLSRRSQFHQYNLVAHMTPMDRSYQSALRGLSQALIARGSDATQAMTQAQAMLYGMLQRQATMKAFVDVFWFLAIVFLCVIPLVFLMKRARAHAGSVMVE
ncbi:MAG TPA: DHA2 family efflux MFS transporter permease subunit [Bryobacteraceae bacterium]|nr:DHA2 family efflux MFS transporter permease subunit [Bryobacteraceae bacterium]